MSIGLPHTVHAAAASSHPFQSTDPRLREHVAYNIGQMLVIRRSRFISFSTEITSRVLGIDHVSLGLTSNVNSRECVIPDTDAPSNNSRPGHDVSLS